MTRLIRRRALAAFVAVAALAVPGCSSQPQSASPATGGAAPSVVLGDTARPAAPISPASVLQIRPADGAMMRTAVREPGARVTLVNVWATWCAPCREEFPELVRLERAWRDRGARVMFVSADFDDQLPAVRAFLSEQGVTAPSWIKTGDDMAFINAIEPRWTGALPATFIYDSRGELVRFWEGKADYAKFESELRAALEQSPKPL